MRIISNAFIINDVRGKKWFLQIGDAIHKIRHLAADYAIPEDVCNTIGVTYRKLKEFEDNLHKHAHLENNISHSPGEG